MPVQLTWHAFVPQLNWVRQAYSSSSHEISQGRSLQRMSENVHALLVQQRAARRERR
jgi:hypothetical protein